jgi:hypothetical protein
MVISERPEIRKVGVNIRASPDILKPISLRNIASFLLILGENHYIGIFIRKVFVGSVALDELVHGNLCQRGLPWGYIDTETIAEFRNTVRFPLSATVGEKNIRDFLFVECFQGSCACRDCFRPEHEDAIDVKSKCIIESGVYDSVARNIMVKGARELVPPTCKTPSVRGYC